MKKMIRQGICVLALTVAMLGGCDFCTPPSPVKVGVVLPDPQGSNDYIDGFYDGVQRAVLDFGIIPTFVVSDSAHNLTDLTQLTQDGNLLIICTSWSADAVTQVAGSFPGVIFVVVDRYTDDPPPQSNVVGVVFREQESGYLAGIVAGLLTSDYASAYPSNLDPQKVVGTLLGMDDIPAVERFRAGFFGGVKAVNAGCRVLSVTTGSFSNPSKGKTDALGLIGAGADIVFAIAGATGNGVYQAASEQGTLAIGVDMDQNSLAPATIITSAIKDVDHATHALIGRFLDHTLQGGTTVVFDHSEGATGVIAPFHSFDSTMPSEVRTALATASAAISAGTVFVPGRKADLLFGTWNGTWTPPVGAPMSDAVVLRADGTYTDVVSFPPAVTNSGTIVIDESASTVTSTTSESSNESLIPVGYSYTASYSFSKDFDTLTFTVDTGGGPGDGQGVYTRQ